MVGVRVSILSGYNNGMRGTVVYWIFDYYDFDYKTGKKRDPGYIAGILVDSTQKPMFVWVRADNLDLTTEYDACCRLACGDCGKCPCCYVDQQSKDGE